MFRVFALRIKLDSLKITEPKQNQLFINLCHVTEALEVCLHEIIKSTMKKYILIYSNEHSRQGEPNEQVLY